MGVDNLQVTAKKKRIVINFENKETTFLAEFDKSYLKRSLENLIDNAIKFSAIEKKYV